MEWAEARQRTLGLWTRIRRMADEPDELALLTEINAMCDMCEKSREEAGVESLDMCPHCLAYQQFGGCRGANAEMSELVVEKDWEELKGRIDRFIESLKRVELPTSDDSTS